MAAWNAANDVGGSEWEPPIFLVISAAAVLGAAIGAVFGFAQWLVLRAHAVNSKLWIAANAIGWAVALPWSFVAAGLGDFTRSVPWAITIGVAAGLVMGLTVAVVTGIALLRIQSAERGAIEASA